MTSASPSTKRPRKSCNFARRRRRPRTGERHAAHLAQAVGEQRLPDHGRLRRVVFAAVRVWPPSAGIVRGRETMPSARPRSVPALCARIACDTAGVGVYSPSGDARLDAIFAARGTRARIRTLAPRERASMPRNSGPSMPCVRTAISQIACVIASTCALPARVERTAAMAGGAERDALSGDRGSGLCARRYASTSAPTSIAGASVAGCPASGEICDVNDGLAANGSGGSLVELSQRARLVRSRAAQRPLARILPSSTPHWSNESMSQITPCTNTACSYNATSAPVGWRGSCCSGGCPSNTRCGTSASLGVPSAHLRRRSCSKAKFARTGSRSAGRAGRPAARARRRSR